MKNVKELKKSTTFVYFLVGLSAAGLGYFFDFGKVSELLMMIGGVLMIVAFYFEVILDSQHKNKKKD